MSEKSQENSKDICSTNSCLLADKCPLLISSTSLKSPNTCMKLESWSRINLGDEISPFIMDLQLLEGHTSVQFERSIDNLQGSQSNNNHTLFITSLGASGIFSFMAICIYIE